MFCDGDGGVFSIEKFHRTTDKEFFRVSRSKELAIETNEEMRFQTILIAQTSLLGSILYYLFARDLGGGRLSNDTQLGAIGCFFWCVCRLFPIQVSGLWIRKLGVL